MIGQAEEGRDDEVGSSSQNKGGSNVGDVDESRLSPAHMCT